MVALKLAPSKLTSRVRIPPPALLEGNNRMKLNAVGITSRDFKKSVAFYSILGFVFPEFDDTADHMEPLTEPGETRLMLDSVKLATELIGEEPRPSNHSHFALEYDSPAEVDEIATKLKAAGFAIVMPPWNAFWGQRYAVVQDPDGYKIDLYAPLE